MTQNWYAVYTRPNKETKLSSILTKKGIQNYCPFNYTVGVKSTNRKPVTSPLFSSVIFIFITENQMPLLRNIPEVLNFMYWKSKPAIIQVQEIELVKKMSLHYINIQLEKITIRANDFVSVEHDAETAYEQKLLSSKYQRLKITLPSLGYKMTAEREKIDNDEQTDADFGIVRLLPRRPNALFSN